MPTFNEKSSLEVIELIESIQKGIIKEINDPFARLADEFYVMANKDLPKYNSYGDFEQIEDGIGMIRYLENRLNEDLKDKKYNGNGKEIGFITGESAYKYIREQADKIEKAFNIKINVHMIKNEFFGGKITVAGLIVGCDIVNYFKDKNIEDTIILPSNMLKADEDIFLDDTKLTDLEEKLNTKILKCKYTGDDLIEIIIDEVIKCQNR